MKRIRIMLLAFTMLLAAPVFLNSCQEDAPEINYTMTVSVVNDFTQVVEAINNGSLKADAAISKLAAAIDDLSGDQQAKLQSIIGVLTSMNTNLETRLAAIEAAMKAQTLSLEGKLGLLETAIKNQTIKQEEVAGKLTDAIDSLSGDMDTKLEAISAAIGDVDATIESKLGLLEAAMKAQTLSLEGKLGLLETAIKNQTIKQEELLGKLTDAIDSLSGDMDTKLEAISAAIGDVDATLESKLGLLEAAMKAQTLSLEGKLGLLETAIKNLPDYTSQLEAIEKAISNLPDYSEKLEAIEKAIGALPDYSDKFDAVVTALNNIKGEVETLGNGQTGIANQIGNVVSAINDLITEVNSGNTSEADALEQINQKLESLKGAIGSTVPVDALSGVFSVSPTKKVRFSKGNLIATIDNTGTPTAWRFASEQYYVVGLNGGNLSTSSQFKAGDMDIFTWSTRTSNYGIDFHGYDVSEMKGDFVDWGTVIDDKGTWRTLTAGEWYYLFNFSEYWTDDGFGGDGVKDGGIEVRKGLSAFHVTVMGIPGCIVIYPDGYTGTVVESYDTETYDDEYRWAKAQNEGVVCLPKAGTRRGALTEVSFNMYLGYSSSTSYLWENAEGITSLVQYCPHSTTSDKYTNRYGMLGDPIDGGNAVRLVTDVR